MSYGLCGAGGTGKTTAMRHLATYVTPAVPVLPSVARGVLAECGVSDLDVLSAEDNLVVQKKIWDARVAAEAAADGVFLSDRTLLDHLAYVVVRCWPALSNADLTRLETAVFRSLLRYRVIWYCPIYWPAQYDGVRNVNEAYQKLLDAVIYRYLVRWNLFASPAVTCVTMPNAPPEQRASWMRDCVGRLNPDHVVYTPNGKELERDRPAVRHIEYPRQQGADDRTAAGTANAGRRHVRDVHVARRHVGRHQSARHRRFGARQERAGPRRMPRRPAEFDVRADAGAGRASRLRDGDDVADAARHHVLPRFLARRRAVAAAVGGRGGLNP